MFGPVSHDPQQLKDELLRASGPVMFDCETTGLNVRSNRVLSYGFRIGGVNYIIYTDRCCEVSIRPYVAKDDQIADALQALQRPGLILVGHGIKFDLLMLIREGYRFAGETRDTQVMLRMIDQDRGFSDESKGRQDISDLDEPIWLNYKLKRTVRHLCNVVALDTPSYVMEMVPYRTHTEYLSSDLHATEVLYSYLWRKLTRRERIYYRSIASPFQHMLTSLREAGVKADADFIRETADVLVNCKQRASDQHARICNAVLLRLSDDDLRKLIYGRYGLPIVTKDRKRSVDDETLATLIKKTRRPRVQQALKLIRTFRRAQSLHQGLRKYVPFIDRRDGRIHSQFDNKQVSGRVSSTEPGLQQIAKTKTVDGIIVKSRNLITATPGWILVGMDIDQADMRNLAHMIGSCKWETSRRRNELLRRRLSRLPHLYRHLSYHEDYLNPNYTGDSPGPPPTFDPNEPSRLVEDFKRLGTDDLYAKIATNITGNLITKNDDERRRWKTVVLAQVNGQGPKGLAHDLECDVEQAKDYAEKFRQYYPDVAGYLALMRQEVALAGQTHTWAGRTRNATAQRWMVDEKRVRLLLTYKDRNHYWFDVMPLDPKLRYLSSYVYRVWSIHDHRGPKDPKLIYHHTRGRIGTRYYKQLDDPNLYLLPVRNLPWSNIRRVQRLDCKGKPVEEARYEGFDATARSAVNTIMQGGTVDMLTSMMLRCRAIQKRYNARLINQVHDELLWEIPGDEPFLAFIGELKRMLEEGPTEDFAVPVEVGMKFGTSYGEMFDVY